MDGWVGVWAGEQAGGKKTDRQTDRQTDSTLIIHKGNPLSSQKNNTF